MNRNWIFLGAILAAIAVGMGAMGAHLLDGVLADKYIGDPELYAKRLDNWKTAALYQMHHSIGLILVGLVLLVRQNKLLHAAGWCFLIGIFLFSGSLYVLSVTDIRALGAIVPFGGVSFIAGWIAMAFGGCCLMPKAMVQIGESE